MPSNAGSVGRDYSFGYFDTNTNQLIDLGTVQNVKIVAQKHDVKNMPYNAPPRYDFIPDGYKVTFSITRTDAQLETLAVAREANFNAGGANKAGYLNETVTEANGNTSRFQFTSFVFFLTDHGDVSREKLITMTGEGFASTKVQIA